MSAERPPVSKSKSDVGGVGGQVLRSTAYRPPADPRAPAAALRRRITQPHRSAAWIPRKRHTSTITFYIHFVPSGSACLSRRLCGAWLCRRWARHSRELDRPRAAMSPAGGTPRGAGLVLVLWALVCRASCYDGEFHRHGACGGLLRQTAPLRPCASGVAGSSCRLLLSWWRTVVDIAMLRVARLSCGRPEAADGPRTPVPGRPCTRGAQALTLCLLHGSRRNEEVDADIAAAAGARARPRPPSRCARGMRNAWSWQADSAKQVLKQDAT